MFGNPVDEWWEKCCALDDLPPSSSTDLSDERARERLNTRKPLMRYLHAPDMPADNMVELIAAHKVALEELGKMLPVACEREGHKWGKPVRKSYSVTREEYQRGDTDLDGSELTPGRYASVHDHYEWYWERVCARCGKIDRRDEVVTVTRKNPFE